MQALMNKKILLGVCGGIAAYKTADLIRQLQREGAQVRVVMTQAAQQFITKITLQALSGEMVRDSLFDEQAEQAMGHIELARWADCILIAPASAHCLAQLAQGMADDLLSTLCLATTAPVLVCPAMNHQMWNHLATQSNCRQLALRGVIFIGPAVGEQACKEVGPGRMSEASEITSALVKHFTPAFLSGQTIVITAGPTREAIDPVRYLSNRSSGKMGYALAQAAQRAGASVVLISGPTALTPPTGVAFYAVESAQQMLDAVKEQVRPGDVFIGAAAVADYALARPAVDKIKRQTQELMTLALIKTPDILAHVVEQKKAAYVVGFAAETTQLMQHAYEKLEKKGVDLLIANTVGNGLGFDVDDHQVIVLTKNMQIDLEKNSKTQIAEQIIAILHTELQNKGIIFL